MAKKITIKKGQLGLVAKAGDYYRVLEAGEHRLGWFNTDDVLVVSQDGSEVPGALADYLRRFQPDWVVRYCLAVDLTADEMGCYRTTAYCRKLCRLRLVVCTGSRMRR